MTLQDTRTHLVMLGYAPDDIRVLDDGRIAWLHRLLFTTSILVADEAELRQPFGSYNDRWCYEDREAASRALHEWNPLTEEEPSGWHRHPNTGRRRPSGDPEKEYINL